MRPMRIFSVGAIEFFRVMYALVAGFARIVTTGLTALVAVSSSAIGTAGTSLGAMVALGQVVALQMMRGLDYFYPATVVVQALLRLRARQISVRQLVIAYLRVNYGGGIGENIMGLLAFGLVGGGVVTLVLFPVAQRAADEAWCFVYRGESYVNYLIGIFGDVYNFVAPLLNQLGAIVYDLAAEILVDALEILVVAVTIILRLVTEPETTFDCGALHGGSCVG